MHTDIFRQNGAKAIWMDKEVLLNRYLRFQTEFEASNDGEALFYICTDTKYELYINGNLVGFGQYEDFPQNKVYDRYDIKKIIKEGKNLVSVLAWSAGRDFSSMHLGGLPMVIFAATENGKCILASDEKVKCSNADAYLSGPTEKMTNERPLNFGFDLRKDDEWKKENLSESWKNAVVCDDEKITYSLRPVNNLVLEEIKCGKIISQGVFETGEEDTIAKQMQYASLAYRDKGEVFKADKDCIRILKDNVYWIADLEEEMAGYLVLDIEAEDGAAIDIAFGEHLADLRVRSYVEGRNYASRCICREGRQEIRFYIQRQAARYLQFFAYGGVKAIYLAGLHEVRYPLEFVSSLKTNDRLLNKIYEVSLKTLDLCIHDHYEDCPQREQSLYGMDSRNQMIAGYYAFGETKMPRASIALLAQGQKESGLLEITAPAKFERTIPCFSLAWVCAIKEYILFSGDIDFAKDMLPHAKKVMEFFELDEEKNLIVRPRGYENWNFYEWTDGMINWDEDTKAKYDAPLNAYYVIALREYCDICGYAGCEEEKTWAKNLIDKICGSFHAAFYCAEKKAYKTYINDQKPHFAQLTQAWALVSGCVPDEFKEEIRESVLKEDFVHASLSHSIYKYDALMQDAKKYSETVLDDIAAQWGYMLYNGATSFWETILGEADFDGAGSLCHGWSAIPAYVFWRYVMGVYPQEVGFAQLNAKPQCKDSLSAEGVLKTPSGIYMLKLSQGEVSIKKQ